MVIWARSVSFTVSFLRIQSCDFAQLCKLFSFSRTNIYPLNKAIWGVLGTPLQYSRLENPMDGGAWWASADGVAKSRTRLSDFTYTFHFHTLEKEMAAHSSVLAWRIPGTGEPGGLPSMGSHRVGHDWSDLAAAAAGIEWKEKYYPIPHFMAFTVGVETSKKWKEK